MLHRLFSRTPSDEEDLHETRGALIRPTNHATCPRTEHRETDEPLQTNGRREARAEPFKMEHLALEQLGTSTSINVNFVKDEDV